MQKGNDLEFELHAYVDGDLDEESMGRVEEYLRKNPETAAKVRDYLRQKDEIRSFARKEASIEVSPAIHELGKKLGSRLKPGKPFPWRRVTLVSLVFALGWTGHIVYAPLAEGPGFAHEFVQAHLLTSREPGEILPISQERLARLFARIGEAQRVPDLRRFGYEAVGAQLFPGDEGLVLHIPYRSADGSTISYFLFHDRYEDEVPRHLLQEDGVSMIYWQHDHSRYAVAAPLPGERLTDIATFLDSTVAAF